MNTNLYTWNIGNATKVDIFKILKFERLAFASVFSDLFFSPSSDAVLSSFDTTTQVQEYISKYLKYAPERMGGGGREK